MPTIHLWEPTILDLRNNPASPWVLVRGNCGHEQYFRKKRCIQRFITASIAAQVAHKLNLTLDTTFEDAIIKSLENNSQGV